MFAKRLALIVAFVCIAASAAFSAVPPMISYQGKLMQPSGAPVPDGTYSIQFAIYDDPVSADPAHKLWGETNPNVQVKGGLFSVLLGSVNNLPGNIFDNPNRFFGVKVGGDPEMVPRQQIASVGYALKAAAADTAATVPDGAITTGKLADASVSNAKIALGAVDGSKIAASSVSADKIMDGAVSMAKVADGAITAAKIGAQEAWHLVGASGQPAFANGWNNYGAYPLSFMKDSLGFVHIQGFVSDGTDRQACFVLPVGYRIGGSELRFSAVSWDAWAQVQVTSAGAVIPRGGSNGWYSISVTFKAEQ